MPRPRQPLTALLVLLAATASATLTVSGCKASRPDDAPRKADRSNLKDAKKGARVDAPRRTREPGQPVHFLSLSDIHVDPFVSIDADPSLLAKLMDTPGPQWRAVFESIPAKDRALGPQSRGHDTSFAVFDSAMKSVAERVANADSKPAFVVISGDFLGHHYREQFMAALDKAKIEMAKGDADAAFKKFVDESLAFVTHELGAAVGDVPVFPAIGNNDTYCGDYALTPRGPFLAHTAELWAPLVERAGETDFRKTFPVGGYYSAPLPGVDRARVIVVDTVFFSSKYENRCAAPGDAGEEPREEQFEWLSTTLAEAKAADERVWLVYHIPPGINVYPSAHPKEGTSCADNTELFWGAGTTSAFLGITDRFPETIEATLAGHIHTDDFRLRMVGAAAVEYIHFTPAISPLFGNNPGYQLFTADSGTAELLDYTTYFLDLGASEPAPSWAKEYTFTESYKQASYGLSGLVPVREAIHDDPDTRALYEQYYAVGNLEAEQLTKDNWMAYWCATAEMSPKRYDACYCDTAASASAGGGE